MKRFDLPATISLGRFLKDHPWEGVPDKDAALFLRALQIAVDHHWEQTRNGGDTRYIEHLLVVSDGLYRMSFDNETQIVGLLHDVVEDCGMTIMEIERIFGERVARMVAANSKDETNEAGFFDQLYEGTKQDFEVIFIRLLDRWHNLTTAFGFRDYNRQLRFLQETVGPLKDLLERCNELIPPEQRNNYKAIAKKVLCLAEGMLSGME